MTEFKCPHCGTDLTVTVKGVTPQKTKGFKTIQEVKDFFPDDLEKMLTFEDSESYILVKPQHYLGSDTFAQIARIIRDAKGEYISAGKESHFRVPKAH